MIGPEKDAEILTMLEDVLCHLRKSPRDMVSSPAERATWEYRKRRKRDAFVERPIFRDPAWDILIDLYVMANKGKQVSISSACIAANVPATTALRWITLLEREGLIIRYADDADQRRIFVALTSRGTELIEHCV